MYCKLLVLALVGLAGVANVWNNTMYREANERDLACAIGGCYSYWEDVDCDPPTGGSTGCNNRQCWQPPGQNEYECAYEGEDTLSHTDGIQTQCWLAESGTWGVSQCVTVGTVYCETVAPCVEPCVAVGALRFCQWGTSRGIGQSYSAKTNVGTSCLAY